MALAQGKRPTANELWRGHCSQRTPRQSIISLLEIPSVCCGHTQFRQPNTPFLSGKWHAFTAELGTLPLSVIPNNYEKVPEQDHWPMCYFLFAQLNAFAECTVASMYHWASQRQKMTPMLYVLRKLNHTDMSNSMTKTHRWQGNASRQHEGNHTTENRSIWQCLMLIAVNSET